MCKTMRRKRRQLRDKMIAGILKRGTTSVRGGVEL